MAFGMHFFRKHQGKLILILGVALMITWFVGGAIMSLLSPEQVEGKMFGRKVTRREYTLASDLVRIMRLGEQPSKNDVWLFLAMQHEADRLGVKVTREEVTEGLRQWVGLHTKARQENLDAAYTMLLERLRLGDEAVRLAMRKQLGAMKLLEIVAGVYQPSDAELWQKFVEMRLEVKLKTLAVPAGDFVKEVPAPGDDDLAAYYQDNSSAYTIPPHATVEYAALLKDDVADVITISDDQILQYYEENKVEEFLLPLEEQDLGEAGQNTDTEAAEETDESAETPPKPEAEETSGDTAAATEPGPANAEASPVADSSEPRYKALSDVTDQIKGKLVESRINALLSDIYADYLQQENKNLEELAKRYGLKYFKVGPFSKNDPKKLGKIADATVKMDRARVPIMQDIFPEEGSPGRREDSFDSLKDAKGPEGHFLYRVMSLDLAREPALEEVKSQVKADYITGKADELAQAEARTILDRIKTGGWQAAETGAEYDIEETEVSGEAGSPALLEAAVDVEKSAFGGPVLDGNIAIVFQVIERREPGVEEFDRSKRYLRLWTSYAGRQAFVDRWKEDLLKRADIQTAKDSGEEGEEEPEPQGL
ncbi:MAG: hypothetical protein J7M19_09085 [Planctomycetes bacterium]|nr:hypothetical protein [Planctomycetota bacterium]